MDIGSIKQLSIWGDIYLGNTVGDYLLAGGILIGLSVVFGVFKFIVLKKLAKQAQKTHTDVDDILIEIVQKVKPPFYLFVSGYIALRILEIKDLIVQAINAILLLWATYLVIQMVRVFINRVVRKQISEEDGSAQAAVQLLSALVTFVLWVLGLLLVLQNLGINVTSLVAGLGIAGLAIAFALQNILEDLFSAFSILFDKPFVVGDFIDMGDGVSGVVEKIGIKTTHLRSLKGEQVIVANSKITSSTIQNFKRMEERRGVFTVGVTYETPLEHLKDIPRMIEEIIKTEQTTRFYHSHLKEFGDSAYIFETIYYVCGGDYDVFLKTHNDISLKIVEKFAEVGVDMAYPTRMIYTAPSGV